MSAFLHPFAPPTKTDFITIVEGDGSVVVDSQGNSYIDAMAGLWFNSVGHRHPLMIEAITDQLTKLATFHTFGTFTNEPAEQLCETIADLSPFTSGRTFLTSSGSESVDSAIKLSRITQHLRSEPQRQMVISRERGYHGVAMGGTSAQGITANQVGFGNLLQDFRAMPAQDLEAMATLFADHGN
ncbi:MAG: aminotransferase class III-fold pyridoxal phosphate-dependent enzyme, partial [Acidimicrobiales bacterium]